MTRDTVELPPTFDDLAVGITLHDPETGDVLDVNERLERLYGYPADELRTMTVGDYTPPSTKFTQEEAVERIRAAADGEPQSFDWQIERANGELRWVSVRLGSTTLVGEAVVVAEVHDVTEYRERERRLRLLSRVVQHNLRNRMNVIEGYADRLRSAVEDETLEKEVATILDIAGEVGELSESVEQIEEIAAPDATQRSPTDLGEVVRDVVETARSDNPGVDLTVDADADVRVVADRGIRYAITHAVDNAIEHNDSDSPTVHVRMVDDAADDRGVVLVADNGPPIPDVETDILDDDETTSSTRHGSGVGLWVMQWCVDSLGGELTFEENDPHGNVVRIALPRANAAGNGS